MLRFPNCKINLGLYVTLKRDDGYHDLETIFYPVKELHDALEIVPAKGNESLLYLTGKSVAGDPEKNLVWKAYKLLQERFPGKLPLLDIYLHKVIPTGAGLGGGSADGAFMLRLLNEYCALGLNDSALAALALQLGSDCPFFIYNSPQFASGRGEELVPLQIDLSAYSLQIICPEIHLSTGDAFKSIVPKPTGFDLKHLASLPVKEWKSRLTNDFEGPIFKMHPELREIKEQLYKGGAIYAAMSGSGSAVYGVFEKMKRAEVTIDTATEVFFVD